MKHSWRSKLFVLFGFILLAGAIGAFVWRQYTSRPTYHWQRGEEALERGNVEEARFRAGQLEKVGYLDQAHWLCAAALYREGRYGKALFELNKISRDSELGPRALCLTGECFLRLNKLPLAERAFVMVIKEQPEDVEARRGLAVLYYDQGAMELAIPHLEALARLDVNDARPPRTLGLIFKESGDHSRAIGWYREALKRGLKDHVTQEVREELARCLLDQKEYANALECVNQCPQSAAATPAILTLKAEAFWGLQRNQEACQLAKQALAKDPHYHDALQLRANLHLEAGEADAAAKLLERALSMDRHNYTTSHILALTYERLGKPEAAAAQQRLSRENQARSDQMTKLKMEAAKNAWDGGTRKQLAILYRQINNSQEAAHWLNAAALCPSGTGSR